MKALAKTYAVADAAVQRHRCRLRRRADVGQPRGSHERYRGPGRGARGARPRGRGRPHSAISGSRMRCSVSAAPRSVFSRHPRRGTAAARAASYRRCGSVATHIDDRRRDGEISMKTCPADQACALFEPGDRIAVVSPASPFARDEFDRGVAELRAPRVRAGLRRIGVRQRRCSRRATASPRARRSCGRGAIRPIAALIAVRGGYGSVQLLPVLDPW